MHQNLGLEMMGLGLQDGNSSSMSVCNMQIGWPEFLMVLQLRELLSINTQFHEILPPVYHEDYNLYNHIKDT